MRVRRNVVALLGATACLVGGTITGASTAGAADSGGASAAASPCDYQSYRNNSSAWGYFSGTYNLKTRPAAECGNVARISSGTNFYVWCYTYNYYGNVWVYGRKAGTDTRGWTSGDNVTYEGGSLNHC